MPKTAPSPTADAIRQQIADRAAATSPGHRFLNAAERHVTDTGWHGQSEVAGVYRPGDLHPAAVTVPPGSIDPTASVAGVAMAPAPAPLLELVEVIPTGRRAVRLVREAARTGAAGGVERGTGGLPRLQLEWTEGDEELVWWGLVLDVPDDLVSTTRAVRRLIDGLLLDATRRSLSDDILAGDGSVDNGVRRLLGVLHPTVAVPVVQRGAEELTTAAVERAAYAVQSDGFAERPLAAVAHPTTLQALRDEPAPDGERTGDGRPPSPVRRWVPSTAVPVGEVVVGDWFAACALYLGDDGLTVAIFEQNRDLAETGEATVRAAGDTLLWVRHPRALRRVQLDQD